MALWQFAGVTRGRELGASIALSGASHEFWESWRPSQGSQESHVHQRHGDQSSRQGPQEESEVCSENHYCSERRRPFQGRQETHECFVRGEQLRVSFALSGSTRVSRVLIKPSMFGASKALLGAVGNSPMCLEDHRCPEPRMPFQIPHETHECAESVKYQCFGAEKTISVLKPRRSSQCRQESDDCWEYHQCTEPRRPTPPGPQESDDFLVDGALGFIARSSHASVTLFKCWLTLLSK